MSNLPHILFNQVLFYSQLITFSVCSPFSYNSKVQSFQSRMNKVLGCLATLVVFIQLQPTTYSPLEYIALQPELWVAHRVFKFIPSSP
jgi:integral membrane sensor domain MASE1